MMNVASTASGTRPREQAPSHAASILEALGAGVIAIREDRTIASANPHAARILRRPLNEIEEHPIGQVVAPLEVLAAAGERNRGELSVELPDGSRVALGFSLSELHPFPGGPHYVLLFQDISPVLELRKQRDRLLQMAVIGDVMPTLLHELRNPLAAVTAMLEVLIEEAEPEMAGDLHTILSEVRRMTLGLQGLGGLVRTVHSPSHCAVDLAVREACRLLEPFAERRGVTLVATGPDMPLLPLDRGVLCGLVFNLVKNAVDACSSGGRVEVDARTVGSSLALRVRDDGSGMTPEVLARCRELFFTTKDSGSGIGLALCAQVAESSGGVLTIETGVGRGTEVLVRVPVRPRR